MQPRLIIKMISDVEDKGLMPVRNEDPKDDPDPQILASNSVEPAKNLGGEHS